jgi:hypothetical protein
VAPSIFESGNQEELSGKSSSILCGLNSLPILQGSSLRAVIAKRMRQLGWRSFSISRITSERLNL